VKFASGQWAETIPLRFDGSGQEKRALLRNSFFNKTEGLDVYFRSSNNPYDIVYRPYEPIADIDPLWQPGTYCQFVVGNGISGLDYLTQGKLLDRYTVALWEFNGPTSSEMGMSSVANFPQTITKWSSGNLLAGVATTGVTLDDGYYRTFNGTSDMLNNSVDSKNLTQSTDWCVEGRIRTTASGVGIVPIFETSNYSVNGISVWVQDGQKIRFRYQSGGPVRIDQNLWPPSTVRTPLYFAMCQKGSIVKCGISETPIATIDELPAGRKYSFDVGANTFTLSSANLVIGNYSSYYYVGDMYFIRVSNIARYQ
jgi:hypothetical protein